MPSNKRCTFTVSKFNKRRCRLLEKIRYSENTVLWILKQNFYLHFFLRWWLPHSVITIWLITLTIAVKVPRTWMSMIISEIKSYEWHDLWTEIALLPVKFGAKVVYFVYHLPYHKKLIWYSLNANFLICFYSLASLLTLWQLYW